MCSGKGFVGSVEDSFERWFQILTPIAFGFFVSICDCVLSPQIRSHMGCAASTPATTSAAATRVNRLHFNDDRGLVSDDDDNFSDERSCSSRTDSSCGAVDRGADNPLSALDMSAMSAAYGDDGGSADGASSALAHDGSLRSDHSLSGFGASLRSVDQSPDGHARAFLPTLGEVAVCRVTPERSCLRSNASTADGLWRGSDHAVDSRQVSFTSVSVTVLDMSKSVIAAKRRSDRLCEARDQVMQSEASAGIAREPQVASAPIPRERGAAHGRPALEYASRWHVRRACAPQPRRQVGVVPPWLKRPPADVPGHVSF
jgi:hypothetical protein